MSNEIKARFIKHETELWNEGNLDVAGELFAPDVVIHNAAPGTPAGLEGVKATVSGLHAAFSDVEFTIEDPIVEGDTLAHRWSITGKQTGEWMGAPPTGEKVTMRGVSMVRFADDKIVDIWSAISPSA